MKFSLQNPETGKINAENITLDDTLKQSFILTRLEDMIA